VEGKVKGLLKSRGTAVFIGEGSVQVVGGNKYQEERVGYVDAENSSRSGCFSGSDA